MPDAMLVLGATAAAAVVAALVMLAGAWPARTGRSGLATLAEVLAIGGGMGIGCWWLGLVPRWPPLEDQDRLLLVLLPAAGIVEILASLLRRRPWFGRVFRLLLALPTPALLLLGSGYLPGGEAGAPSTWTGKEALAILLGLGVLLAAVWGLSIRAAQRPAGFVVPAALGLISAAAGVCMILSGYATGGLIGLPLCRSGRRSARGQPAPGTWPCHDRRGGSRQRVFVRPVDGRAILRRTDDDEFRALDRRAALMLADRAAIRASAQSAGAVHRGIAGLSRPDGCRGGSGLSQLCRGDKRNVRLWRRGVGKRCAELWRRKLECQRVKPHSQTVVCEFGPHLERSSRSGD